MHRTPTSLGIGLAYVPLCRSLACKSMNQTHPSTTKAFYCNIILIIVLCFPSGPCGSRESTLTLSMSFLYLCCIPGFTYHSFRLTNTKASGSSDNLPHFYTISYSTRRFNFFHLATLTLLRLRRQFVVLFEGSMSPHLYHRGLLLALPFAKTSQHQSAGWVWGFPLISLS